MMFRLINQRQEVCFLSFLSFLFLICLLDPFALDLTGTFFDARIRTYPPKPENFNPSIYYWPNEYGRYIQYFQSILPTYPAPLQQQSNENALGYATRLLSYRDRFDNWMFACEAGRRKGFAEQGHSRIKCEYMIGMYSFLPFLIYY